jgi:hypothetical protein
MLAAAVMLVLSTEAAAQTFKCTDAAGKISYSGTECSALGLKDAGEVKDRLQITPAPPAPTPSRTSPQSAEEPPKPAAAAEPETPERRCFTTSVKGRSVTRCNDQPDEPQK